MRHLKLYDLKRSLILILLVGFISTIKATATSLPADLFLSFSYLDSTSSNKQSTIKSNIFFTEKGRFIPKLRFIVFKKAIKKHNPFTQPERTNKDNFLSNLAFIFCIASIILMLAPAAVNVSLLLAIISFILGLIVLGKKNSSRNVKKKAIFSLVTMFIHFIYLLLEKPSSKR